MDDKTKRIIKIVGVFLLAGLEGILCLLGGYTKSSTEYLSEIENAQSQRDFFHDTNSELNKQIRELENEINSLKEQIEDLSGEGGAGSLETLIDENAQLEADYEDLQGRFEQLKNSIDEISNVKRHNITLDKREYEGHATVSSIYAGEGEEVLVKLEPANGYRIVCSDSVGNTVMSEWNNGAWSFIMPSNDVTIEVLLQS